MTPAVRKPSNNVNRAPRMPWGTHGTCHSQTCKVTSAISRNLNLSVAAKYTDQLPPRTTHSRFDKALARSISPPSYSRQRGQALVFRAPRPSARLVTHGGNGPTPAAIWNILAKGGHSATASEPSPVEQRICEKLLRRGSRRRPRTSQRDSSKSSRAQGIIANPDQPRHSAIAQCREA